MRKKVLSLFLSLALFVSMPVYLSPKALGTIKNLDKVKIINKLNELSDGNLKLSEKDGQVFITGKLSGKLVAGKDAAVKFLNENKLLFGIDSITKDLKILDIEKDDLGHTYVKFVQVIDGIEVEGSTINVHFDKNGGIASINGNLKGSKEITALGSEVISESQAVEIAKKQYTFDSLRNTPRVEKVILTEDNNNYEVYKVNISYTSPTVGNYDVFIEVNSGEVIKTENNIRFDGAVSGSGIDVLGKNRNLNLYKSGGSYQMNDVTKEATSGIVTYSMNNGTYTGYVVSNSSNYFGTEYHKASVSAHYNAGKVIDFYKNLFNRNSLDGNGMVINSFTHYGSNYNNAFWDGYEMVYGDGDGSTFTYLSGDLDVVGHEMTHGIIDYTAKLDYHNESGALNESIADVFGVLISTYDKYNVASGGNWTFNTTDWVIGDDIYTPYTQGDALRSLSNPILYGQPDNMNSYAYLSDTEAGDFGGVHTNSGIINKAAYNVAKSIGMEKTARIYYRALVNYMSAYTNFEDARNCFVQAATDLYGGSSTEVKAINNAFYSVGIGQAPVDETIKPITSVKLNKTSVSLKIGEKISLLATVSPQDATNKNVIWKSNNSSIAKVDSSGEVIAIGPGTATITAKTEDGGYIATCKVTVSLAVPISVEASSFSYNSIKISWASVTGANGYEVYRSLYSQSGYSKVATITGTSFNNSSLATNKIYYYKVKAYKTVGSTKVYSNYSSVVSAKPIPAAATNLKATRTSSTSIKLTWSKVAGANGYEIYRSTSKTGTYSFVGTTTNLYYTNSKLTTGKTYYYKVRVYRTIGPTKVYSNWSVIVAGVK